MLISVPRSFEHTLKNADLVFRISEAAILDRTRAGAPCDHSSAQHLRAHTRAGFDVHASLRATRRNPRGATVHDDPSVMFLRLKAGERLTEKPHWIKNNNN